MLQADNPHTPALERYRVKAGFKDFISRRFGVLYAHASLSRRASRASASVFAPVAVGPGGIPVFSWPAVELRDDWLEAVDLDADPRAGIGVDAMALDPGAMAPVPMAPRMSAESEPNDPGPFGAQRMGMSADGRDPAGAGPG